jgi:hypothetical protein
MPDATGRLRADRTTIERAARRMRDHAISDGSNGWEQPARALALALVLDELARQVRDLDEDLRCAVVAHCRAIVDTT